MKPETKRLIAAVIVAPLAIGFVGGLVGLIAEGWKMAGYFFAATSIIAAVFTLLYGLPVHLVLKRLGRSSLWVYLVAAIPAAVIIDRLNAEYFGLQIAFDAVPGGMVLLYSLALLSMFTAGIAWAIARPDKSEASTPYQNITK